MRILSLSTQNEACGIADVNDALQAAMKHQAQVYDVHPITSDMRVARSLLPYESYLKDIDRYDATLIQHEFKFFGSGFIQSMRNFGALLARLERAQKPSLVVLHTNLPETPASRPLKWNSSQQKMRRAIKRFVGSLNKNAFAHFVVHGEPSRAAMIRAGLNVSKITRIHHPMRQAAPSPIVARTATEPVTLGVFGFIADYKGYRNALEAMLVLPERFHLRIVGGKHPHGVNDQTLNNIIGMIRTGRWTHRPHDGPLETNMLHDRVTITGFVPDVTSALEEVDIILAPYTSDYPPGSGALTASLSHGKPIIASATPPFAEIAKDGNCLKLVAIDAPFELAKAIEDLASDPAELHRLSHAALEFSRRNSWEACASIFVKILATGIDVDSSRCYLSRWLGHTPLSRPNL